MLSAAVASAIPRLRCATRPRLRRPSARTYWPRPLSSSSSSSSHVAPAAAAGAGAGELEPPDLTRLANAARISLSPQEAEDFEPKIRQVVDLFEQLQAVDLDSIEPSLRAGTTADSSLREDKPETFDNRDEGSSPSLCTFVQGRLLAIFPSPDPAVREPTALGTPVNAEMP